MRPREIDMGDDPHSPWATSVEDVVAHVEDGMRISVSGVHFTRAPVRQLVALVGQGVSGLTYVAWGGGLALDLLLAHGCVDRAEICFSNADVYGLAPRFRASSEAGTLEVEDLTALQLMTGLRAAAEKIPWATMQAPQGSVFDDPDRFVAGSPPVQRVDALEVDVMLLHAQRADDLGNVEIIGARATDVPTAFAAAKVLVTVEERVRVGELDARSSFILPRDRVTALALAPGGAGPTSCLPYYAADISWIGRVFAAESGAEMVDLLREPVGVPPVVLGIDDFASVSDALRAEAVSSPSVEEWTVDELMTVWLSRTVDNRSICTCGSSAPLPVAAYMLAKRRHAPLATLISMNGCYVDVAERPLSLGLGEWQDFLSAAQHGGSEDTYRWYYQAGRITHEVVGAAQLDAHAATNNQWVTRAAGGRIRLPGQGGMADVANLHRDFMVYLPRQSRQGTPERVAQISSSRAWADPRTRTDYGYQPGRTVVLTDLCVMEPGGEAGRLQVTSLHPGVAMSDVQAVTGFDIEASDDCDVTVPPDADELRVLRNEVDPLGVRRLDFVPARARAALLAEILANERAALATVARLHAHPETGPHS
jgi:glutaconate CoA-transferase subunit A